MVICTIVSIAVVIAMVNMTLYAMMSISDAAEHLCEVAEAASHKSWFDTDAVCPTDGESHEGTEVREAYGSDITKSEKEPDGTENVDNVNDAGNAADAECYDASVNIAESIDKDSDDDADRDTNANTKSGIGWCISDESDFYTDMYADANKESDTDEEIDADPDDGTDESCSDKGVSDDSTQGTASKLKQKLVGLFNLCGMCGEYIEKMIYAWYLISTPTGWMNFTVENREPEIGERSMKEIAEFLMTQFFSVFKFIVPSLSWF
jgi:hypothetical protein